MSSKLQPTRDQIRDQALELGFDAIGIAPAGLSAGKGQALHAFLNAGRHGDMTWMADRVAERASPNSLWPEARSVIVLGINYGPDQDPLAGLEHPDKGMISVYAQGSDYHDLVKKRLKQLARWLVAKSDCGVKVFVDTAPVLEKAVASESGVGWQGKHTNLVSHELGSWLFLGEVFTTLELEPDEPTLDACGTCDRCLRACPTDAFPSPYQLDARRCISYLTIEHKGDIAPELMANMGNRIYGCDDCLSVCPWNKFSQTGTHEKLTPRAANVLPDLAELAMLDDAAFRERFRASPIKRTGRDRFVRNVLIAMGNSGEDRFVPIIEKLLGDPADVVRHAAQWARAQRSDK